MADKQFSDEAETCAECLAQEFTIEHGAIRGPGKFEAEPLAAYHAYHVMLDGGADDDDGPAWRVGNVICEESEQGFVGCDIYDDEADAIEAWEAGCAEAHEEAEQC